MSTSLKKQKTNQDSPSLLKPAHSRNFRSIDTDDNGYIKDGENFLPNDILPVNTDNSGFPDYNSH